MSFISGRTILTGLLGDPIRHSRSPQIHNTSFEMLGLPYAYLCFTADEETLPECVRALKALGARGWNCTMPVKQKMASLCDELSEGARLTGSVNTVVLEDGRMIGYNTDGTGYMQSLNEAGIHILGQKMTLFGTGGAARSILAQAGIDGVKEISVFARPGSNTEKARQISLRLSEKYGCRVRLFGYEDEKVLRREIGESRLLVNATNIGMGIHREESLIRDPGMFVPGLVVSDVIYEPETTRFLALAAGAGCRTVNGLGMMLYQGAEAFSLWTGRKMPVEQIRGLLFCSGSSETGAPGLAQPARYG